MLDQFLAIHAHLLRPYIQVCLLRFLRSLSLFDFWRKLLLLLASFCLPLCVFSPSFTSVCTTLVSWLLLLPSLRCVVSPPHFAARRFLKCLESTQPLWSLRSSRSISVRVFCDRGVVGFSFAGFCVLDGTLSYVCVGSFPPSSRSSMTYSASSSGFLPVSCVGWSISSARLCRSFDSCSGTLVQLRFDY